MHNETGVLPGPELPTRCGVGCVLGPLAFVALVVLVVILL